MTELSQFEKEMMNNHSNTNALTFKYIRDMTQIMGASEAKAKKELKESQDLLKESEETLGLLHLELESKKESHAKEVKELTKAHDTYQKKQYNKVEALKKTVDSVNKKLKEKDKVLTVKDKEIAQLKKQLASLKKLKKKKSQRKRLSQKKK